MTAAKNTASDRRLFAIEERVRALNAKVKPAAHVFGKAEELLFAWKRAHPKPARVKAKCDARYIARWEARYRSIAKRCRYHEKKAAFERLDKEIDTLCSRASRIRVTSIEGMQSKARLIQLRGDLEVYAGGPELAVSIVSDLLTLKIAV
jgi:hypothetical protein